MALATLIEFEAFVDSKHLKKTAYIASINCRWAQPVLSGGPGLLDAAIITNPVTEITKATTVPFGKSDAGTIVRVRMGYDDGVGGTIVNPTINVFGRTNADAFERLMNQDKNTAITLTVDPTNDVTDGTFKYTLADILLHSLDMVGCDEILIGVTTAFTATVGIVTNSFFQVKLVN